MKYVKNHIFTLKIVGFNVNIYIFDADFMVTSNNGNNI